MTRPATSASSGTTALPSALRRATRSSRAATPSASRRTQGSGPPAAIQRAQPSASSGPGGQGQRARAPRPSASSPRGRPACSRGASHSASPRCSASATRGPGSSAKGCHERTPSRSPSPLPPGSATGSPARSGLASFARAAMERRCPSGRSSRRDTSGSPRWRVESATIWPTSKATECPPWAGCAAPAPRSAKCRSPSRWVSGTRHATTKTRSRRCGAPTSAARKSNQQASNPHAARSRRTSRKPSPRSTVRSPGTFSRTT